ncbi:MAG: AI-2E family transporter [Acidobacteria bacterium]|nr:MAG: AI-2E family transporter [Acidobacteriota bacterium]
MDSTNDKETGVTTALVPRSFVTTGLFVLALFYTLYLARDFFLPIVLAILLHFLLRPAVRALKRARIGEPIGAGVVLALLIAVFTLAFYELSGPASQWLAAVPPALARIEKGIAQLRGPVQQVRRAADQVEKMTAVAARKTPEVQIREPGLTETVFAGTRSLIATLSVMVLLLYFLLASGDLFLEKTVKVLPTLTDKKRAVGIANNMEDHISRYLLSMTAINVGLGVAQATAMFIVGIPNPVLWGFMASVLNFIPYLGAMVGSLTVATVGYLHFGEVGGAALAGLTYFGITCVEGGFITPMLLARRLTLNPVILLVGIIFWGWLWGIAGALLAVPLMSSIKIFCDHIEPLAPVGEFMGR